MGILQMKRGRPKGYGYQISKLYNEIFAPVTQRSIYYHLRKGMETQEIKLHNIEREKGQFSWGEIVEKTYYVLGNNANPTGNKNVEEHLKKWKMEQFMKVQDGVKK
jgi:hypothetical protein